MSDKRRTLVPIVLAACGLGLLVAACKRYRLLPRIKSLLVFDKPSQSSETVKVVSSLDECRRVVSQLEHDSKDYRVLGFDCEWVTVNGVRRPVALLQICSNSVCALIRLSHLKHVPLELQQILTDESILKVGVAPLDDAKLLAQDYNVYMEAPDGDLLCTMDKIKADWYLRKGLAKVVTESPLRMRLCFEPHGRAIGEPGAYDRHEKTNRCVVCGETENYSRKFVIPKEYRKFYPVVIKSHSSHDVLLLCPDCHRISQMADNELRERLAIMCGAPLVCHKKYNSTGALY